MYFILTALVLAVPIVAVGLPHSEEGTVFAVYPGWDQNDGEGTLIQGGTEAACLEACSTNRDAIGSTCIAYSYVPYGATPACFLKPVINLGAFSVDQGRVVTTGLAGACGTFKPGDWTNYLHHHPGVMWEE
ncbi:hypothetical protein B0H14DRAFT_3445379 [Mycena olivaceomarginata]|nr:hypothetical protein B0H14DRAFT_3445379 [Mycena olivaceomarginata]